jgi:hypothetical protein
MIRLLNTNRAVLTVKRPTPVQGASRRSSTLKETHRKEGGLTVTPDFLPCQPVADPLLRFGDLSPQSRHLFSSSPTQSFALCRVAPVSSSDAALSLSTQKEFSPGRPRPLFHATQILLLFDDASHSFLA